MFKSNESNAVGADEVSGRVWITHPFHPRCGEELELVERRVQWGDDRVFYRSVRGHISSIRADWTNVGAEDPMALGPEGPARFRVVDLIELSVLLSGMRS